MDLPVKFPLEIDKIQKEAASFRRMSPEDRSKALLEVIVLGAAMMEESPHREAMLRLQEKHEEEWKNAQRELFKSHGL